MKSKKTLLVLFLLLVIDLVLAIPYTLDQQGVLRNATTGSLLSGTYNFNVTLYNVSGSSPVYSENKSITLDNGVWNYEIGLITPISASMFKHSLYVKTKIGSEELSAANLTTVPYAFYSLLSNDSDYLGGQLPSYYTNIYTNASFDLSQISNTGNVDLGDYSLTVNTSTFVVNASTSRVGIGTTSPQTMLHVYGSSPEIRIQVDTTNYSLFEDEGGKLDISKINNGTAGIKLSPMPSDGTSIAYIQFFRNTNTTGTKAAQFYGGDNTNTIHAQIGVNGTDTYFNSGGNVGIGTATPTNTLNVVGDLNVTGTSYLGDIEISADLIITNTIQSKDGNITFENSTGQEKMRITADGRVGIGITTPSNELEVIGTVNASSIKIGITDVLTSDNYTTDTNCSATNSCPNIVYSGNTSWITSNQLTNFNATQINITHLIGNSTYYTLQDWVDTTQSAGSLSGGSITSCSDEGYVNVTAGTGFVKTSNDESAETIFFNWTDTSYLYITGNNNTKYKVYVDYNSGSPTVAVTTGSIDYNTQFSIGSAVYEVITNVSGDKHKHIHILNNGGTRVYNLARRIQRAMREPGFERSSGSVLGSRGLNITITSGVWYAGINRITTSAYDSDDTQFRYYFYNGSDWIQNFGSIINNTYYNDITSGLSELTANRYGVHWVYQGIEGDITVIYGRGDYTLAGSQVSSSPSSVPTFLNAFGTLVGRVIIKKGDPSMTETSSAFEVTFTPTATSEHSELAGLTTGDDHTQYMELDGSDKLTGNWDAGAFIINASSIKIGIKDVLTSANFTVYTNSSFDLGQLASTTNVNIGDNNFSVNVSTLFVDTNLGRVGIGAVNPQVLLDVGNPIVPNAISSTAYGQLIVGRSGDNYGVLDFGANGATYGWIQYRNRGTTAVYPLVLNPLGGNVGIGTLNPVGSLHVNATDGTPFVVNATNGRVGIGTTSPSFELDIIGNANITGMLNVSKICIGTDCQTSFPGTTYTNASFDLSQISNTGNVDLGDYSLTVNTSTFVVNATTSKVGIGTSNPTHKLNVVGDMNVTGTSYVGDDKKIYFGDGSDVYIMFNSTGGYGELG